MSPTAKAVKRRGPTGEGGVVLDQVARTASGGMTGCRRHGHRPRSGRCRRRPPSRGRPRISARGRASAPRSSRRWTLASSDRLTRACTEAAANGPRWRITSRRPMVVSVSTWQPCSGLSSSADASRHRHRRHLAAAYVRCMPADDQASMWVEERAADLLRLQRRRRRAAAARAPSRPAGPSGRGSSSKLFSRKSRVPPPRSINRPRTATCAIAVRLRGRSSRASGRPPRRGRGPGGRSRRSRCRRPRPRRAWRRTQSAPPLPSTSPSVMTRKLRQRSPRRCSSEPAGKLTSLASDTNPPTCDGAASWTMPLRTRSSRDAVAMSSRGSRVSRRVRASGMGASQLRGPRLTY